MSTPPLSSSMPPTNPARRESFARRAESLMEQVSLSLTPFFFTVFSTTFRPQNTQSLYFSPLCETSSTLVDNEFNPNVNWRYYLTRTQSFIMRLVKRVSGWTLLILGKFSTFECQWKNFWCKKSHSSGNGRLLNQNCTNQRQSKHTMKREIHSEIERINEWTMCIQ